MLFDAARRRLCVVVVTALTMAPPLAACSSGSTDESIRPPVTDHSAEPVPDIVADTMTRRGSIVSSETVPAPSPPLARVGGTQITMVYRSVSGIDGGERVVSGTVVVPSGSPPPGGWPIIAYGHGLTGIGNGCGPSGYPDLLGYDLVVASLVQMGYVVALSDYEGLGYQGAHPLLEPKTAAFNLIDSVRAARQLVADTSTKWFAVGVSQGGQASWAANEYAGEYGDGLDFLGSASLSPAADISKLPALAEGGWLTKAQQILLPTLVYGLRVTHPDLDPADYLHGTLARNSDMWLACTGPLADQRSTVVGELTAADSEPVSPEATGKLADLLSGYAIPQRPATAPMLVITGADDETVRAQWVRSAVEKSCGMGDVVEFIVRPNEGHTNLNGGPRLSAWLTERMAGAPPIDSCGEV